MFKYLWVSFGTFLENVKIDPKITFFGVQNLILDPGGSGVEDAGLEGGHSVERSLAGDANDDVL